MLVAATALDVGFAPVAGGATTPFVEFVEMAGDAAEEEETPKPASNSGLVPTFGEPEALLLVPLVFVLFVLVFVLVFAPGLVFGVPVEVVAVEIVPILSDDLLLLCDGESSGTAEDAETERGREIVPERPRRSGVGVDGDENPLSSFTLF